jgi:hypothetical protein
VLTHLRRLPWWFVLGAFVLLSAVLRTWASRGVPTPWIAPDEQIYGLLGQGLYRDGSLSILGGPTPYYSAVVPAVVGLPLSIGDLALGHSLLQAVQALVMSLAALPVFLWGRSFMAARWALVAAALTLALPGLAYSGLVMTEGVFYPVFVLAAWSTAAALVSPTRTRQALVVGALCLAVATRLQAIVLLGVIVTAFLLDAAIARRRPQLRRFAVAAGGIGALLVVWLVWHLARGGSQLGGYEDAGGSYPAGAAARFVGYHLGDLALLTGVFPACALLVLAWRALRSGEEDRAARAYVAVALATAAWLVLEVGVFASRELGLLAERNLVAVAPVLFLGFGLWLDRGGPGSLLVRGLAAAAVALAIVLLPLRKLVVPDALPHAFTLIPLSHLRDVTSAGTMRLTVALAVVAAAVLFALVPRRALVVLPALLFVALAAGSVSASREVADQARTQQQRLLGPVRRWVDDAADGPTAYVYDGQAYWNAVWENLFWNRRIRSVYDLPGTRVPGPLPQTTLVIGPGGELLPDGKSSDAAFAVVPLHIALRGEKVAESPQVGTDRRGLGVWRLDRPLRLDTITSGLFENGDVDREASLTAYDCRAGTFVADLLVKEPQTVSVFLNGRLVRRTEFPSATTSHVRVPARAENARRTCKLLVSSDGLLGTTRFGFDRA